MFRSLPALFLAAVPPPQAVPWTPADSARAAARDCAALASELRQHVRYLDLGAVPPQDRSELIQALSGHCNSLSREVDLAVPAVVPGTQGALVRINLLDYGWRAQTWELLVHADPYYQLELSRIERVRWPGGTWPLDGIHYPAGAFTWNRRIRALAPWLHDGTAAGKTALATLAAQTRSQAPLVRGDWFLWYTAIQEGRSPGYYDFLQITKQADFERLVRFDAKLAAQLERRAVVVFSGIALQPRRVERTATVLGGLWRTFDNRLAQGENNPLVVLDDRFRFQATRQIAPLANGLPAWWLADNKGNRQLKAPDDIVGGDRTGGGNDTRLHIYLSCIRCHLQGKAESVIKDLNSLIPQRLSAVDYRKLQELRRLYHRALAPVIEQDRRGYEAAIGAATGGMTGQEWSRAMGRWYSRLDDARVDLAFAGQELGMPAAALQEKLALVDKTGNLHPTLSVLLGGGAVPVTLWFEVYGLAQVHARGYVLPADARIRGR